MAVVHLQLTAVLIVCLSVSVNSDRHWWIASKVRVRTEAGWVRGLVRRADDGSPYASFRGVPYGEPPLGANRFKELEPVTPWEGDWDATEDSAACPQKDLIYGSITLQKKGMSEDCIYLNVHVPYYRLPRQYHTDCVKGLPILVMIHGGGFNTGSGLTDLHGPDYLMNKDVMVITFNYRINVFGFLSLKCKEIPGNQGLRDQVTLLRWVQRNARAFGGDPDNVTIMGHSLGAASAHILTLSQISEGLFQRAILLSGTAISGAFTTSPKFAKEIADVFLSYLGINSTDSADIHKQLIQLPLVDIMHANTIVQNIYGLTTFVPVVEEEKFDGVPRILIDTPFDLIAKGRGKQYPLIVGITDTETEFFRWICMTLDMVRRVSDNPRLLLSSRIQYNIPEDQIASVTDEVYNKVFNGTPTMDKYLHYLDYTFFKYPAFKLAEWRANSSGAPMYLYQYSYRSERNLVKRALWLVYEGSAHLEDLTYVFKVTSLLKDYVSSPPKNDDDRMKDWMTTMVTNFMRCSNPTCTTQETHWPPAMREKAQYQSIAEPGVHRMSEYTAEELDMTSFLDSIDRETRY